MICVSGTLPAGDALDFILMEGMSDGKEGSKESGMLQGVASTLNSLQRFMRSLQN
jgi:hypothetical protein